MLTCGGITLEYNSFLDTLQLGWGIITPMTEGFMIGVTISPMTEGFLGSGMGRRMGPRMGLGQD